METGRIPNIHWRAVSLPELRKQPAFQALPPVDGILINGLDSYRYIRQEDPLWKRLHAGVLTTGHLPASLGFYEPSSSKRLKLGRSRTSHNHLLNAYHHLCQAQYVPQVNQFITEQAAEAHNVHLVSMFNDEQQQQPIQQGNDDNDVNKTPLSKGSVIAANSNGSTTTNMTLPNQNKNKKKSKQRQPEKHQQENYIDGIEAALYKSARSASNDGLNAVRCAWGKTQEASSILLLTKAFPQGLLIEAGLFALDPSSLPREWGFEPGSLPPLGASPDALIRHHSSKSANSSSEKNGGSSSSATKNEALLESLSLSDTTTSFNLETADQHLVEIVEVKNTCPFAFGDYHTRSRNHREYILSDRGPRREIDPVWIPQLQLHMLCAKTASGLLVSRSATKGTTIFRVQRDDAYLKLLLEIIKKLYTEHVQKKKPPMKDSMERWPGHGELVSMSRHIARNAELILELEESHVDGFGDDRFFLN